MDSEIFSIPVLAAVVAIVMILGKVIELLVLRSLPDRSVLTDSERGYIKDTNEILSKCDTDGTPLVYVPRSWAEIQKDMQHVITKIVNDQRRIADILDRIEMFFNIQKEIMLETETVDVGYKAVEAIIFGERLKFSPDRDMLLIIIEPSFNMHISSGQLMENLDGIIEIVNKRFSSISILIVGILLASRISSLVRGSGVSQE